MSAASLYSRDHIPSQMTERDVTLYCLGKVLPLQQCRASFVFPEGVFLVKELPLDDRKQLEMSKQLVGDGVFFEVLDGPRAYGAIALWNEASTRPRGMVIETRLGAFVHTLMFDRQIKTGGLVFADGGIETEIEGSADHCWQDFLDRISKPWDQMDNPLFIWRNE